MIIRFIDSSTGTSYDARRPYITFIARHASTSKWYERRLMFVSDASTCRVHNDESSNFAIVDPSKLTEDAKTTIEQYTYFDMSKITTHDITLTGVEMSGVYVYSMNVVCAFDDPGEYVDAIYVGDETFDVGCDAYVEEENLGILLANAHGHDIPDAIQGALYPANVRDDSTDAILMNRKRRELLLNYLKIFAGVGTYESMLRSLAFFEYGDATSLVEYWRQQSGVKSGALFERELTTGMNGDIQRLIQTSAKTTFVGISCALDELKTDDDGEVVYNDHTTMFSDDYVLTGDITPVVERRLFEWERDDMMLKMRLVEMFYDATFLPIHISLLHATCEDIVFDETTKYLTGARHTIVETNDDCDRYDSTMHRFTRVTLEDAETYADNATPKAMTFDSTNTDYDHYDFVFGVKEASQFVYVDENDAKTTIVNVRRQSGAVINVTDTIHTASNAIQHVDAFVYKFDASAGEYVLVNESLARQDIVIEPDEESGDVVVSHAVFFADPGNYVVTVRYVDLATKSYTRSFIVRVVVPDNVTCDVYKIKRRDSADVTTSISSKSLFDDTTDFHIAAFDAISHDDESLKKRPQLCILPATETALRNIGLTHVLFASFKTSDKSGVSIVDESETTLFSFDGVEATTEAINTALSATTSLNHYITSAYVDGDMIYVNAMRRAYDDGDKRTTNFNFVWSGLRYYVTMTQSALNSNSSSTMCSMTMNVTYIENGETKVATKIACVIDSTKVPVTGATTLVNCANTTFRVMMTDATTGAIVYERPVTICHTLTTNGNDAHKLHFKGVFTKSIDTSRMIPMFHDVVKMTDEERLNVDASDCVMCVRVNHRYIRVNGENPIFRFVNRSVASNKTTSTRRDTRPMFIERRADATVSTTHDVAMSGYYDIVFECTLSDEAFTQTYDSMFRIVK